MNLKIETFLFLEEEEYTKENIAGLSVNFSDIVVLLGYGNVGAENPEDTRLKSVIVVKPARPDEWQSGADDAMAINFPTDDETFVAQADQGGIIE